MPYPKLIHHLLKRYGYSSHLPGRPENCGTYYEDAPLDKYQELVHKLATECNVRHLVISTGFEGGGMRSLYKSNLRSFIRWCWNKYKLTCTLCVHDVTKGCFGDAFADGIELLPYGGYFCYLQPLQNTSQPRQFFSALFATEHGGHLESEYRNRVFILRIRITDGTCRALWFRCDGKLKNSKYTDIDPALWEQQRIPGTDEYLIPLSTHGGGDYKLLLETRSGDPRYGFISCNEATPEELAPFMNNGKYMGHLAGRGGLSLTIPYTVPGLQMDYTKRETRNAVIANAQSVAAFIAYLKGIVTSVHIRGDEPKVWKSHQDYVDAVSLCAGIYHEATGLPVECWGDGLCGHNSRFDKGVYDNLPSPTATDWGITKELTLDVWGDSRFLETGLQTTHAWGADRYNICLSPHWSGGWEAVCDAQARAAKNLTLAQINKIFWGKIRLHAYVEDFDHALGENGKPGIKKLFDRFNQTLLNP